MRLLAGNISFRRRRGRGRSGVAVVEMAVLLPVLMMIMLGMLELSRAVMVKQILTDAARKGCRTGIIYQYGNSDINSDVIDVMSDNQFNALNNKFNPPGVGFITITVTDPNGKSLTDALGAPQGSIVSVQVSIPVSSFTWIAPYFLPGGTLESDLIVMMKQ